MKISTEHTPNCQAIVTVELDEAQVNRALQDAAQTISRIRPIPGFRPGKAPYARVERMVGKEILFDQAIEALGQSLYKQILQDEKIEPYDQGKLDIVRRENPVTLQFTIPMRPVVTLGDYRSIHLQPQAVQVTDAEVDEVLERKRNEYAEFVPVTRPAQFDDLVAFNVKGGIPDQLHLDREGLQVHLTKEKPLFPWLDQLVGMLPNEPRTITFTYPPDAPEGVAGKTATYDVIITEIKEKRLPALDDEFARAVSSSETLDQFKKQIRNELYASKEQEEQARFEEQVIDAVVAQAQIAFPDSMLDDQLDLELERAKEMALRRGFTWEKYLRLVGKDERAYREEARPRTEARVKQLLALLQVAEEEKIQVTEKEVDVEIDWQAQAAARSGERADQKRRALSTPDSRKTIQFNLRLQKAVAFLVASAKGEPTSGKIVTPAMVLEERRQRALAEQSQPAPTPGGLITDPSQIRPEDWPRGLERPVVPGRSSEQ